MGQDYTTMRVPTAAHEAAKDAKRDGETWGEYLRRCGENPPEVREFIDGGEDVRDQLDRIERAATTAEERTGAIEKTLEEMGR